MVLNFICRESKKGKNGLSPLELSIIINGKRKVISLDRRLKASTFNPKSQKAKEKAVNAFIEAVRTKLYSIEVEMIKRGFSVTVENVVNIYKNGFPQTEKGIVGFYSEWLDVYSHKKNTTIETYNKYKFLLEELKKFVKAEYKASDYPLKNITPMFCEKFFQHILKVNANNTAVGKMKKFKSVLQSAVDERYIDTNPCNVVLKLDKVETVPLTLEEVNKIRSKEISIERLGKVRDIFVFMIYTGLSYCDAMSLTKDNIRGNVIVKRRGKTKVDSIIPLLEPAVEILEKYDYILPNLSNQKLNSYLREIQDICGIGQKLHCHLARHTFATLLLNAGVDMTTVSKCCGHSSTKITESTYATMLTSTIVDNVNAVASKIV